MRSWFYGVICGSLLAAGVTVYGQARKTPDDYLKYLRDDAPKPPPRERVYPPEWYAAAEAGETMFEPKAGMPVTGNFELQVPYAGQEKARTIALYETRQNAWRDGAGRLRIDLLPQPVPNGIMEEDFRIPGPTTSLVLDPVSRCTFLWKEGYRAEKVAHVSCMRKDTAFATKLPWDEAGGEEQSYRALHPDAKFVSDRIGEKLIGNLKAVGYRHYEVGKDADGKEVRTYWGERWFSPELGELVMTTLPERGAKPAKDYTDFLMRLSARTEPDEALFYPPVGYEIKVDKTASAKKP